MEKSGLNLSRRNNNNYILAYKIVFPMSDRDEQKQLFLLQLVTSICSKTTNFLCNKLRNLTEPVY